MDGPNLKILYEDNHLIAVFKPAGVLIQGDISGDRCLMDEVKDYLKEQEIYVILYFNDKPIAVNPPLFVNLVVKEAMPGVRGDTAQGAGSKPATLESGAVVSVPLFIEEGDLVKIDTRKKEYI